MLWYKRFYYELDPDYLTQDSQRGPYLFALALSLFFYGLLLILLFLEIPRIEIPGAGQQKSIIPHGNDLLDHMPRRSTPARVVSLPAQPQKTAPATPPPPALPGAVSKQIIPSQKIPALPEPVLPEPIFTEPAPSQPEIKQPPVTQQNPTTPLPFNNERNGGTRGATPENPPITATTPAPQLPTRRGRQSWVKNPEPRYPGPRQPTSVFAPLEDISKSHVTRLPTQENGEEGMPSYGSPLGKGGALPPEQVTRRTEFELFATRFIHNLCDTSRQKPLYVEHTPITTHTIRVIVTISRDRRIKSVHFSSPSPQQHLNHYLEEIMHTTLVPQLPASWPSDELTMPMGIDMYSAPGAHEVWLVPIRRS